MVRKGVLLGCALLVACGSTGGDGYVQDGFFTLYLNAPQSIQSYAVQMSGQEPVFPDDAVTGQLVLYSDLPEAERPRAFINRVEFCVNGRCFRGTAGGTGEVQYGTPVDVSVVVPGVSLKTEPPWVILNPYEDEVLQSTLRTSNVSLGTSAQTETHVYSTASPNIQVFAVPIVPGSLQIETEAGTYSGYVRVENYSYDSTLIYSLPVGSVSGNQVSPGSLTIVAADVVCIDDGGGGIRDLDSGSNRCSGGVDYGTGYIQLRIASDAGSPPSTSLDISYDVVGSLFCYDNGAGTLIGDCESGIVNYSTGDILGISFSLTPTASSVPLTVVYSSGTGGTNSITYVLPPQLRVGYADVKYGRVVEVYVDGVFACSLSQPTNTCTVSKTGDTVQVSFYTQVTGQIQLSFSEDSVLNINPAVDARATGHLVNGNSFAVLSGELRVEVLLETGEVLSVSRDIDVVALPEQAGGQ